MTNESINKKQIFDKSYTLFMKGIAVLILLLHHLMCSKIEIPLRNFHIDAFITDITKVCVAIFTILSGYGLTKSYEKNKGTNMKFILVHLKKLILNYWCVYIPAFVLSFFLHISGTPFQIYGLGLKGIISFLLDLIGLRALFYTPTLNNTWWYMEIIIIYYIFFPLLHKCIKKFPVFSLLVATLPCVLIEIKGNISILISTDREIFYVLPFLIGILLADKKILDKLVIYCNKNRMGVLLISILSILVFQYLSTQFRIIPNVFYAMAIILLGINLKSIGLIITKYLEILGKNSMNIFLVHSFYYYYFIIFYKFMSVQKFFIFKYLELLLISLGTSILIEKFKVDLFIKRKIEDRKIETEEETKEELEEVYVKK